MAELTPAQKRKITLEKKLGKDWRKKIGQSAKSGLVKKYGEDGYKELQKKAARLGGLSIKPENRTYSKNNELAVRSGKKRASMRYGGKND